MLSRSLVALGALLPLVLADCGQYYVKLDQFVEPNACVPGGYFQAQDLGQQTSYGPTDPSTLVQYCEAQCSAYSNCEAYVGELQKAADSNLYTGQCFFYSSPPSGPVQCADHPTIILAEQKFHSADCLTSSPAAATAFCQSYLSIGTVTDYTSTSTPVSVVDATETTYQTTVKGVVVTSATTSTKVKTSKTITTDVSTQISTKTVTTKTTTTTTASAQLLKRSVIATPPCLATAPASIISAACSCLSVASPTISTVSIAPTSTSTLVVQTTSVRVTDRSTSTKVKQTIETTTVVSVSTKSVTSKGKTTATVTSVIVKTSTPPACTQCSSSCVDLKTDNDNCGACGHVCASGTYCKRGSCAQQFISCNNPTDGCSGEPKFCISSFSCACYNTANSGGVCGDPDADCGPPCTADADCGSGRVCYTDSCCNDGTACSLEGETESCINSVSATKLFRRGRRSVGSKRKRAASTSYVQ